eukprot:gene15403-18267_t
MEEIYRQAKEQGANVKAVILCSPNNPTGTVFSRQELQSVIDWCRDKKIHLVSDEIYALSTFNASSERPFVSVYELCDGKLGDNIHILSGFSKDFCVNGYRAGYIYSQNTRLLAYVSKISVFFSTSNPVQSTLANILLDDEFLSTFITTNQSRLLSAYEYATLQLKQHNIPYVETRSGFFIWLDLRLCLQENTFDAEMALWEQIFDARVLLNPGKSCLSDTPGFFRFIFTHQNSTLKTGIERIAKVYKENCRISGVQQ